MRPHLLIALAMLVGCPPKPIDTSVELVDLDGDGYEREVDCDDAEAAVHPGAAEVCNGADDDCDGFLDEDDPDLAGDLTLHRDGDGDAWGSMDPDDVGAFCEVPAEGWVEDATDCDDADPAVHPEAQEVCNGEDEDCDGEIDEAGALPATWYADADGDGYGDEGEVIVQCAQPSGYVLEPGDCDDADAGVHPEAAETCDGVDQDCDGEIDEGAVDAPTWYTDADADGWGDDASATAACEAPSGWVDQGGDCDEVDPSVHPEATEVCDGLDQDCDGAVDDDAIDAPTWYADADGDGYGDPSSIATACTAPSGYGADATDCDDAQASVHPGADEHCDGVDENCDGAVDEYPVDPATWYADTDGDGFGDAGAMVEACAQPTGHVGDATDCDDTYDVVFPRAEERCDSLDNDCDGAVDLGAVDAPTWYEDGDGDGFGDPGSGVAACAQPSGYLSDATDCDDADGGVHPGADEHCDGADEDCDGFVDEGAVDATIWHPDADGDGYGTALSSVVACTAPAGTVADGHDCDDTDSGVHPGAAEHCDGADEDCDGVVDDAAVDALTWYPDADGDAFGDASSTATACAAPTGYVADDTDCDDTDAFVYPGADEHCDGADENCDGVVDDSPVDPTTWYRDTDGDGYGSSSVVAEACTQPTGYAAEGGDCNDRDGRVHPGADEHCDGVDEDCDGNTDEDAVDGGPWYTDADGDGYGDPAGAVSDCAQPTGTAAVGFDCDDGDASVFPGADEYCDGVDDDCDGGVDEGALDMATWYADGDGDGYGDPTGRLMVACDQPTGFTDNADDCDDGDDTVNPGALEICDGRDNDCDGAVDGTGMVSFVASTGAVSDLSAAFATGTATAAYASTLYVSGALTLCPGTYYAELSARGADVSVVGLAGSGSTSLTGDGVGSIVAVSSTCTDLAIEGLTLEGGDAGAGLGGGINAGTHGVALLLDDVVIQSCDASYGGGIYQVGGSLDATGLTVQDCVADYYGGGIYLSGVAVDLESTLIDENVASANYGGGLYAAYSSVRLDDVTVSNNSATLSYAGGAFLGHGTAVLSASTFDSNTALYAGGLMVQSGTAALTTVEIDSNQAYLAGGGLYVSGATTSFSDTRIHGNWAGTSYGTGALGGGLFLTSGAIVSCSGSTSTTAGVYGNYSSYYGGGALLLDSSSTLVSSVCDWGTSIHDDNSPDDVAIAVARVVYKGYHSDASFTCSGSGGCY